MKNIIKLPIALFLLGSSCIAYADNAININNSLDMQCSVDKDPSSKESSTFIRNATITFYNSSIMWRAVGNPLNAINIKIKYTDGNGREVQAWYGALGDHAEHGSSAYGLSSLVQAMYILREPVDVCVNGKYLRGIENHVAH